MMPFGVQKLQIAPTSHIVFELYVKKERNNKIEIFTFDFLDCAVFILELLPYIKYRAPF